MLTLRLLRTAAVTAAACTFTVLLAHVLVAL